MIVGEYGIDPQNPEAAGAKKRYHHGHNGIAKAAETSAQRIHDAAEQVGRADDTHTLQTELNGLRIRSIDVQELRPEEIEQIPHGEADDGYRDQTGTKYFADPFILSGTEVLACEGYAGLIDGVHGYIDKALQIGGSGISCHGNGTEGIDGRLDQYIG